MDGIEVLRVWTWLAPNKGHARRILNYLSYMVMAMMVGLFLRKPDIMIATSPQFFCGIAGMVLKKIRRFRFILEIRDIWPESITTVGAMKKGWIISFLEWLEKAMYRSADHIVAVGEGYRQNILSKGVTEKKTSVIYNGADLEKYIPGDRDNAFSKRNRLYRYGRYGAWSGSDVAGRAKDPVHELDMDDCG